jgi:outer membrane protein with beta-barrel domain
MMAFLSHGAFAQNWFVSPMVGSTFHTKTGFVDLENAADRKKLSIGVGGGRFIGSRFGVEGEVAWLPGFFNGDGGLVNSSRVVTTSGNLLMRGTFGKIRPYGTIGAGGIFVRTEDVADVFTSSSALKAVNGGGGVMAPIKSWTFRADVRYFVSEHADPQPRIPVIEDRSLRFWRVSVGVIFQLR